LGFGPPSCRKRYPFTIRPAAHLAETILMLICQFQKEEGPTNQPPYHPFTFYIF